MLATRIYEKVNQPIVDRRAGSLLHRYNEARGPAPQWEPMVLCHEAPSFNLSCQCVSNLQYRTSPFLRGKPPAPQSELPVMKLSHELGEMKVEGGLKGLAEQNLDGAAGHPPWSAPHESRSPPTVNLRSGRFVRGRARWVARESCEAKQDADGVSAILIKCGNRVQRFVRSPDGFPPSNTAFPSL